MKDPQSLADLLQSVGWLEVYETDAGLASTAAERELMTRRGMSFEVLNADEVRQLKASGTNSTRAASKQAPYLQLDAAIRRLGMASPARLEPRGQDGARAQFENVSFDKLVRMLGEMDASGVQVTDISISRREAGAVNVNLVLAREP